MIEIKNQTTKYFFFGILAIPRGLYLTLSLIIFPVYLYDQGVSIELVTLIVGLVTAPWVLKFLLGSIIDRYAMYGRKIFIILGGISSSLSLFGLGLTNHIFSVLHLVGLLLFGSIGLLFLDIAQTAWAIDITDRTERGKINGIMFGSYFLTMAICSSSLGLIAKETGYLSAFIVSGIIILLTSLFTVFFNEDKKTRFRKREALSFARLKKEYVHLITVFSLISAIGGGLLILVAPLFMRINLEFDIAEIGLISSLFLVSRAIGSVMGGSISDKYGRKTSLALFIVSSLILAPVFIITRTLETMGILYATFGLLLGGYQSITSAVFMDISHKETCATQYSVYASIFNAGRFLGEISAGTFIVMFGFQRIYLLISWLSFLSLLVLYFSKVK